jgi:hypothetical protein
MQRLKSLNIQSSSPVLCQWPNSMPSLQWREWILAGDASTFFDVSNCELGAALKLAYPQLGLSALAYVISMIPEQAENVCQTYDLRINERLSRVFELILLTPAPFQKWVDEKKMPPRDLFPLLAVKDLSGAEPILLQLARSALSKTQGAQALEWAIELFLMERPLDEILSNEKNWWSSLRKIRRPKESEQDEKRDRFLKQTPWPSRTNGQWLSHTDSPALEVKLQARSPRELDQMLEKLKTVVDTWRDLESSL